MLSNTGGGLLTNGRTKQKEPDLPSVSAMKPMQAPQMPQQAPQQQAVQPQQAPQQPGQQAEQQGVNTLANNGLMLLHDERTAPQYEKMIMQGEEGAAHAAVTIGQQVIGAYRDKGVEPDVNEASDAILEIVGDIVEIGMAQGSIPQEPVINGIPAGMYATLAYASDKWTQIFPDFGRDLASQITEATQQDQESARAVAAYMKQRKSTPNADQSTAQ